MSVACVSIVFFIRLFIFLPDIDVIMTLVQYLFVANHSFQLWK